MFIIDWLWFFVTKGHYFLIFTGRNVLRWGNNGASLVRILVRVVLRHRFWVIIVHWSVVQALLVAWKHVLLDRLLDSSKIWFLSWFLWRSLLIKFWIIILSRTLKITLLFNVRMLLIFLTLIVFIIVCSCASVASFVLISGVVHLLLHVWCESWVLRKDFFFCHLESLEQEVCLSLSNLVMAVLGKIFTSLELEVLLILNLFFVNVVLERLLFNLHFDVLFLLGW